MGFAKVLVAVAAALAVLPAALAVKENIVFMLTDDQDTLMSFSPQPKVQDIMLKGGAHLINAFASTPVCCPSRGGIQTGRYIHNIPMKNNSLAGNCSGPAWREGAEKKNFATLLKKAGYRTFYGGKYLNTYGEPGDGGLSLIPPGWDDWQGLRGNSIYYNYELSNNGQVEKHGSDPEKDYLPKVLQRKAMAFLQNVTGPGSDGSPFFLMMGTPSCHDPTEPAAEYASLMPDAKAPRPPNYNNYSQDKHWFVKYEGPASGHPQYTDLEEQYNDLQYRRRALTLLTVDDIVGNITSFLKDKGLLDNTYIFYASDHGYHLGQFSMLKDKRQPYEFDVRIPSAVRGPGIEANSTVSDPVVLIDYAPTFLEIAGVDKPDDMDGQSFLSAVKGEQGPRRTDLLLEYHGEGISPSAQPQPDKCQVPDMFCAFVGPEMNNHPPFWNRSSICSCQDSHNNTYECVRTLDPAPSTNYGVVSDGGDASGDVSGAAQVTARSRNWLYCQFSSGFEEFYDLDVDPWQRHNQINDISPDDLKQQRQRLDQLRTCRGSTCV